MSWIPSEKFVDDLSSFLTELDDVMIDEERRHFESDDQEAESVARKMKIGVKILNKVISNIRRKDELSRY